MVHKIRRHQKYYLLYLLSIFLSLIPNYGCDQGLAPIVKHRGISGTVYFMNWLPIDSLRDLRVVAFKDAPSGNIVSDISSGRAEYTSQLQPFFIDSISYRLQFATLPAGKISYIAVAQQYGPNSMKDWRVVGVFYADNDTTKPGTVNIPQDSFVDGVNIFVNFHNIPPQP
jgi:hypothetical protein